MSLSRRTLLGTGPSAAAMATLGPGTKAAFSADAQNGGRDILVVVFLRFGCDGLTLIPPSNDADYHAQRPTIGIPASGPGAGLPIGKMGGTQFFFHPSVPELKALYDTGSLAIVNAVGVPTNSRSHFDIQDMMERGIVDADGPLAGGWLSRHLMSSDIVLPDLGAVASAPDVHISLQGFPGAVAIPNVAEFNVIGGDFHLSVIEAMNSGEEPHAIAARETAKTIRSVRAKHARLPVRGDDTGYTDSQFSTSLRSIADLIKMDTGLDVATVDYGGWDHHFEMNRYFPSHAAEMSKSLSAFWHDMADYQDRITVVAMTEFGRRLEENANGGTDHGAGAFMFVLGGAVRGGKMYGQWPGLKENELREGDLRVTTDYRQVIQEILIKRRGESSPQKVFPSLAYESLDFIAVV
ncbi:MAG: DUF1501 domain-containing protein [Alphaproteobacteria bacterium]|nr:DUF1501 domain-containing protein [Alphaproteobacteria bacterium]